MEIGEQTIIFLAVNKNGDEVILDNTPARQGEIWTDERSTHDDEYFSVEDHNSAIVLPKGTIRRLTGRDLKWEDDPISLKQGGIEKGFVDKEMFEYKFDYISSALEDYTNISVYNFYCDNNDKDNINRKPNTGMIDQYMDYIKFINDNVDEENKIIYDTIMMIGDASGKEGQFSDSDKKTAENFGCEYMDVDDFVYKYNNR